MIAKMLGIPPAKMQTAATQFGPQTGNESIISTHPCCCIESECKNFSEVSTDVAQCIMNLCDAKYTGRLTDEKPRFVALAFMWYFFEHNRYCFISKSKFCQKVGISSNKLDQVLAMIE